MVFEPGLARVLKNLCMVSLRSTLDLSSYLAVWHIHAYIECHGVSVGYVAMVAILLVLGSA